MKKWSLIFLMLPMLAVSQQGSYSWGFQSLVGGSRQRFTGGDVVANARFQIVNSGVTMLGVTMRNDFSERWTLTAGLQLFDHGFSYGLREDYSLKHRNPFGNRVLNMDVVSADIPVMIFHKSRLNCRNVRFILGGGLALQLTGKQTVRDAPLDGEGVTGITGLQGIAVARPGAHGSLRLMAGVERVLKRGRIVQIAFEASLSRRPIARSQVSYSVDGVNYMHRFATNGSYFGIRTAVYLFSKAGKNTAVVR